MKINPFIERIFTLKESQYQMVVPLKLKFVENRIPNKSDRSMADLKIYYLYRYLLYLFVE